MGNDRQLGLGGILGKRVPSLRAVTRIVKRMQITGVAKHHCPQTDPDTRLIHHVEHIGETFMHVADQITDCTGLALRLEFSFAKIEQAISCSAIAHLVIQAGQYNVISLT